jgi:hypothetical protein
MAAVFNQADQKNMRWKVQNKAITEMMEDTGISKYFL